MTHEFSIDKVDTLIYGLHEFLNSQSATVIIADDIENIETATTIKWTGYIEVTQWGYNGYSAILKKAIIDIKYDHYDVEDDKRFTVIAEADADLEHCIVTIEGMFHTPTTKWELVSEMEFVNGALYPTECEVDFSIRRITVR